MSLLKPVTEGAGAQANNGTVCSVIPLILPAPTRSFVLRNANQPQPPLLKEQAHLIKPG